MKNDEYLLWINTFPKIKPNYTRMLIGFQAVFFALEML